MEGAKVRGSEAIRSMGTDLAASPTGSCDDMPPAPDDPSSVTRRVDEFMTSGEVAAILRLNPQTVRNSVARGEIRAIKIGRNMRIRRVDLGSACSRSPGADTLTTAARGAGR